ncbi:MAG: SGNH/GDSL hydrolase family protein [Chloroflexi bacterium CFX4]|nr:SGNH/GDSL hydrolase family protein [Chloroflexi bacterium CFX4]MDL1921309.1 hypothetical protein [Chloroflexi bacterium CFX3]
MQRLLLCLILVGALLIAPSNQVESAEVEVLCTQKAVPIYSCANCADVLFHYPANALLFESAPVDAEWISLTDTATGERGFIRAGDVQACRVAAWQLRPVLPDRLGRAREIYAQGLALGNNPNAFSIVGDCQSVPAFFLGSFENPSAYNLGGYSHLQAVIKHFKGSFDRRNMTVHSGFNVASVLAETWADPNQCEIGETPLMCEYRLHKPSIAFVSMETIWSGNVTAYERHLRQIVEYLLEQGVVPILVTKADNIEGGHRVNEAIVRVADSYGVPLWNFWLAVQGLPNHGLQEDGFHLTFSRNLFNDRQRFQGAWAVRNLTALQALDRVWRGVQ